MPKTVIGVFRNYNQAESVLNDLTDNGFVREDISIVAADRTGTSGTAVQMDDAQTGHPGTGAAIGGAAGLAIGLAGLAIPGFGPVLVAGPLVSLLTAAGVGAAAGGIVGALANVGVPHHHATLYANAVRQGQTVVAIRADGELVGRAESILNRNGAVDVDETGESWREANVWRPSDPHSQAGNYGSEGGQSDWGKTRDTAAGPQGNLATDRSPVRIYDPEQSTAPDLSDPELMQHYHECWEHSMKWDEFGDAYRLGQSLGVSGRYGSSDWVDVESDARRHWEAHRPNTWKRFNDVVRFGWEHVRGKK